MKKILKSVLLAGAALVGISGLSSCKTGVQVSRPVPYSLSSASAVTVDNLNLSKGDYEVLNSITETASVLCEYKGKKLKIYGDNESFVYEFESTLTGWVLTKFQGVAELGYFTSDIKENQNSFPNVEEFARRMAMSRIIRATKDYQADGVVEPVVISNARNIGNNKIEYTTTVSAKLISIKTTRK